MERRGSYSITIRRHRGVTIYEVCGGLDIGSETSEERDILYCVVTRLEIGSIKNVVFEIDPTAFVTTHSLSEVDDGLIKKPALH